MLQIRKEKFMPCEKALFCCKFVNSFVFVIFEVILSGIFKNPLRIAHSHVLLLVFFIQLTVNLSHRELTHL